MKFKSAIFLLASFLSVSAIADPSDINSKVGVGDDGHTCLPNYSGEDFAAAIIDSGGNGTCKYGRTYNVSYPIPGHVTPYWGPWEEGKNGVWGCGVIYNGGSAATCVYH